MIDPNKLSVGILLPIESYEGAIPKMENQTQLIQRAEALGFDTVWVRDIPLNNPDFKEEELKSNISLLGQTFNSVIARINNIYGNDLEERMKFIGTQDTDSIPK